MIYWQKYQFFQQLSQKKLVSVENVYDYMRLFGIFDKQNLYESYFIDLNMKSKGWNLSKSLNKFYGLDINKKHIDSFMINSQLLVDRLNKILMEKEENLNCNLKSILLSDYYSSKQKLIEKFDFENKQKFYIKLLQFKLGENIKIYSFCNILNELKIKILDDIILTPTKEYAFFFVYLKMKCLGYKLNDDNDAYEQKYDDDDDDDDTINIKDKMTEIFDIAFEDLFTSISKINDDDDDDDDDDSFEIDIVNYKLNIKQLIESVFFIQSNKKRDNEILMNIINEIYIEAMEVMEQLKFEELLKDKIKMIDIDTVFAGMEIYKVNSYLNTKMNKKSRKRRKSKMKKKLQSTSDLFDDEDEDDEFDTSQW